MLQWQGCEAAILASGPSMSAAVASQVLLWKNAAPDKRKVVVINTTFRLALWADALYACDFKWWDKYIKEVRAGFEGELWTQDPMAQEKYHLNYIKSIRLEGLCSIVGVINQGENSGYQTIGLLYHAGVKKMLLFGWDMHGTHWHKPHPGDMERVNEFHRWLGYYPRLALDLAKRNVSVVNYTKNSALRVFPFADINTLETMSVY